MRETDVGRSGLLLWQVLLVLAILGVGVATVWGWKNFTPERPGPERFVSTDADGSSQSSKPTGIPVQTVRPGGGAERVATQPGSVLAYQTVQIYAKASGFLKTQNVDIGDKVKQGDVLAIVDVPELTQSVAKAKAVFDQFKAKVEQMKARAKSAEAEHQAARASIAQAEANAKSSSAMLRYRSRQYDRLKELFDSRSIDERLVDESKQQLEAASEAERSATASVATSKAQAAAKEAKIAEAKSDILEADAGVEVARAEHERLKVQFDFATIAVPFDGVVTARYIFPGDYVRAANESSSQPLFTVQRVDRMRVIVQVADRDVPYVDVGDQAVVELDALPGQSFPAKISRLSQTEDPLTRMMNVEIDVPNPSGRIRQGMYGRVRLVLDKASDQLSIPSTCLVGRSQNGKASAFVVRDGKAKLVSIKVGDDDGVRVAVTEGLASSDQVIIRPPSNLTEGLAVVPQSEDAPKSSGGR
ncbi:MAG: efflux RND transporter periplasmic adaptor subunit [Gemmataceae bacterium]|nr:efflux RND transporter periplasmic adaptor subunit [Gemmataceae bacterium]